MRSNLLLTSIALVLSLFIFGQSLELAHEGTTLEPNEVVYVEGSANAVEIVVEMDVTNTAGSAIDVLVQRYEEYLVPGASSAFCWGLCFPPNVGTSPYAITIDAGATNSSDFSGHYYPDGHSGESTVSYVFYDENNPNDSVMVTVVYKGMITGVEDLEAFVNVRAYPNPASDVLNIELSEDLGTVKIELIDMTGSVVKELQSTNVITSLSTKDMAEGLYFYRVISDNTVVNSSKIVIRH